MPAASTPRGEAPASESARAGPGHAFLPTTLRASSASITAIAWQDEAHGASKWRLADTKYGLGDDRVLIVYGAEVDGRTGTLFALPGTHGIDLDGRAAYVASMLSLSHETHHHVAEAPDLEFGLRGSHGEDALDAAGFRDEAFFARTLHIDIEGPLTLRAERLVLVTQTQAEELGSEARLSSAGVVAATAPLTRVLPAGELNVPVTTRRAHVAFADASGDLVLADEIRSIALVGPSLVTLDRESRLRLAPDGDGVLAHLEGRAFQILTEDGAQLRSSLTLRILEPDMTVEKNQSREVAFELIAADPDADPVITNIRIEGAREGLVRLPGYVPITQQLSAEFGDDTLAFAMIAPTLPAFAILDAFVMIIDGIFGGAKIPQTLEAGTTFASRLTVASDGEPYEATIVIEGNFPTAQATIRVG